MNPASHLPQQGFAPVHPPQRKLYFLHIMKSAGTTLRSLIEQNYPLSAMPSSTPADLLEAHAARLGVPRAEIDAKLLFTPYRYLCAHTNYIDVLPDGFEWITVLREPVARLRSLFRHWQTFTDEELGQPGVEVSELKRLSRQLSLEEFLAIDAQPIRRNFFNGMTKSLVGNFPVGKHVRYSDEQLVEEAKRTLDRALCVGTTERFDDFVRLLCYVNHWPAVSAIQPLNVRQAVPPQPAAPLPPIMEEAVRLDRIIYDYGKAIFERQFEQMCRELAGEPPRWTHTLKSLVARTATPHSSHAPFSHADFMKRLDQRAVRALLASAPRSLPASVCLTMDQAIRGDGWLEREGIDINRVYRWTGPSTLSTLDFVIAPAPSYEVALHVISVIHADILEHANLTLNGAPSTKRWIESSDRGPILRAAFAGRSVRHDGFARLAIATPRTASHIDVHPNCGDDRQKGLAIEAVCLAASQA